jgi:hypothetical protein
VINGEQPKTDVIAGPVSTTRPETTERRVVAGDPASPPVQESTGRPNDKPATPSVQVINSRKFRIGYKLHDVEPERVAAIELYITQDGGAAWFRYPEEDKDKQSPMQVEVRKEGTYGFALGVRTSDGQATEVPKNGDAPAIEVVVDETPPQIELLPLRQGRDQNADKVLIQWSYSDAFPAEQPISLYYAADASGPWHRISDWMENTGKFVWKVDNDLPPRFLVRVEARDRAGNMRTAETPKPVALHPTSPASPTARVPESESAKKTPPK